jgi:hypothetical protein
LRSSPALCENDVPHHLSWPHWLPRSSLHQLLDLTQETFEPSSQYAAARCLFATVLPISRAPAESMGAQYKLFEADAEAPDGDPPGNRTQPSGDHRTTDTRIADRERADHIRRRTARLLQRLLQPPLVHTRAQNGRQPACMTGRPLALKLPTTVIPSHAY